MKITLLVQIHPKYCMRYTKMWGSSLKYVSNNSNIKDKGQLRLLKNAIVEKHYLMRNNLSTLRLDVI